MAEQYKQNGTELELNWYRTTTELTDHIQYHITQIMI